MPPADRCPSTETLYLFLSGCAEGQVDPEHLETCAHCRGEVERIAADEALVTELLDACHGGEAVAAAGEPKVEGYVLEGALHRGGQGVVYRGRQLATKRTVAIKLLLDGAYATAARRRRFEREIELVAQLDHPGIVTVFDSGVTGAGQPWLAMEYIEGHPLGHRTGEPREVVLERFARVCDAVQFAHQRGVIHRDLKPGERPWSTGMGSPTWWTSASRRRSGGSSSSPS